MTLDASDRDGGGGSMSRIVCVCENRHPQAEIGEYPYCPHHDGHEWFESRHRLDQYALQAECAAHQETLLAYRTIEALLGMLDHSESVDEDVLIKVVNDKVSKLVTAHQETQAKLAAWLALGAASPHGLSVVMDAACEMGKLREQRLAETQAIARELTEALDETITRPYYSCCDLPCNLCQKLVALIAKAKGALPAVPPPSSSTL